MLRTLFTAAIICSAFGRVTACSCVLTSIQGAYDSSDVSFDGTVVNEEVIEVLDSTHLNELTQGGVSIEEANTKYHQFLFTQVKKYTFNIQFSYKGGDMTSTIIIYTGMGNGDCGLELKVGKRYIVYATTSAYYPFNFKFPRLSNEPSCYWSDTCSKSTEYTEPEAQALRLIRQNTH